jgi:hypothetical protein
MTIVNLLDSGFKMKERSDDVPDRLWRTISPTLIAHQEPILIIPKFEA